MSDRLTEAALELGLTHGRTRGNFINRDNCSPETALRIINGHAASDPEFIAWCPDPMSGPSGNPPAFDVIEQIADKAGQESGFDSGKDQDIIAAYESAFKEGFWEEVLHTCRLIVNHP